MALVEVQVPDIGDFKDVEIIEVLVKPGDTVAVDQSLLTVESDKASMEIPSTHGGVVKEMKVGLGDKVSQGSPVLVLEAAGGAAAPASPQPSPAPAGEGAKTAAPVAALAPSPAPRERAGGQSGGFEPHAASPLSSSGLQAGTRTASEGGGTSIQVVVPDIGDFDEVAVIEVMVKPGDTVKAEQSLITVESDKASMEIPSSHAGVVERVLVAVGDKVAKGSPVVLLQGVVGGATPRSPQPSPAPAEAGVVTPSPAVRDRAGGVETASAAMPTHEPAAPQGLLPHASPSIRRLARELGVPLAEVTGSGPKGRITQVDLQRFVKGVMAGSMQTAAQKAKAPAATAAAAPGGSFPGLLAWPQVDYAKFGPVERKDLSRIKKISGANLHRNWVLIPHVTNHDDADITDLEAFRVQLNKENEKSGVKVTMLAFLIKASVAALKKFPDFNASLDGDQLVLKNYFHIGFAADTPNGLMVPVVKDADKKGVLQISQEMGELAKKARDGKLGPAEMTGGCFSISSLGGIGGRYFTPIINAPEVSILGVCKSSTEPRWDGKQFVPRLMLPLSLSWDHRVIDGASAARFNAYLGAILADFRRVLL